jgi:hypothetical protein
MFAAKQLEEGSETNKANSPADRMPFSFDIEMAISHFSEKRNL